MRTSGPRESAASRGHFRPRGMLTRFCRSIRAAAGPCDVTNATALTGSTRGCEKRRILPDSLDPRRILQIRRRRAPRGRIPAELAGSPGAIVRPAIEATLPAGSQGEWAANSGAIRRWLPGGSRRGHGGATGKPALCPVALAGSFSRDTRPAPPSAPQGEHVSARTPAGSRGLPGPMFHVKHRRTGGTVGPERLDERVRRP